MHYRKQQTTYLLLSFSLSFRLWLSFPLWLWLNLMFTLWLRLSLMFRLWLSLMFTLWLVLNLARWRFRFGFSLSPFSCVYERFSWFRNTGGFRFNLQETATTA